MISTIGQIGSVLTIIGLIYASWKLPRTFGLLGVLGGHFVGLVGFLAIEYICLTDGTFETYEPEISMFFIFAAILFNAAMLPISIFGMIRWRWHSPISRDYVGHDAVHEYA